MSITSTPDLPLDRGPLIAIPLYRSAELVPPLCAALREVADEVRSLGARILLLNDSPDDFPLADALKRAIPTLSALLDVELIVNPVNLGFVKTANVALSRALSEGRDA